MDKLFYPAIFEPDGEGFSVEFPDVDGAITGGDNMEDAYKMAFDCLGIVLSHMHDDNEVFPTPSKPQDITLKANQFVVVVEFDMAEYMRRTDSRAVKRTVSGPSWLIHEAERAGVSLSATLQDALRDRLGL